MALINLVDKYDLQTAMKKEGRDNFTLAGYEAIVDFYDTLEGLTELCAADIDCSFVEFNLTDSKGKAALIADYGYMLSDEKTEYAKLNTIRDTIKGQALILCDEDTCFVFEYNF